MARQTLQDFLPIKSRSSRETITGHDDCQWSSFDRDDGSAPWLCRSDPTRTPGRVSRLNPPGAQPRHRIGGSWSIGNFVYERFIMTVWFPSTMLTGQRLGFAIPNLTVFRLSSPPKPQVVSRQSLGHWRGSRRLPLAVFTRAFCKQVFSVNVGDMMVRSSWQMSAR